jgi:hypothetical protein
MYGPSREMQTAATSTSATIRYKAAVYDDFSSPEIRASDRWHWFDLEPDAMTIRRGTDQHDFGTLKHRPDLRWR